MSKRQAIMLLLTSPGFLFSQQPPTKKKEDEGFTFSTTTQTLPTLQLHPANLTIWLRDKEQEGGIGGLVVKYGEETKTFTAKEIWEALK